MALLEDLITRLKRKQRYTTNKGEAIAAMIFHFAEKDDAVIMMVEKYNTAGKE